MGGQDHAPDSWAGHQGGGPLTPCGEGPRDPGGQGPGWTLDAVRTAHRVSGWPHSAPCRSPESRLPSGHSNPGGAWAAGHLGVRRAAARGAHGGPRPGTGCQGEEGHACPDTEGPAGVPSACSPGTHPHTAPEDTHPRSTEDMPHTAPETPHAALGTHPTTPGSPQTSPH